MVSSPLRAILLLSFSSPHPGTPLFAGTGSILEEIAHFEVDFEESRVVALMLLNITCIRILDVNICLYKSVNQLWNYWEIIGE